MARQPHRRHSQRGWDLMAMVDYWYAQLDAALLMMGERERTLLTKRDDNTIHLSLHNGADGKDERAALIRNLERRGFTITSATPNSIIEVDAPEQMLKHDYTGVVDNE